MSPRDFDLTLLAFHKCSNHVLAEAGQWQHALQVLCQMEPLTPDITSQNIAMNACGLQSQWQRVIDMLEDGQP